MARTAIARLGMIWVERGVRTGVTRGGVGARVHADIGRGFVAERTGEGTRSRVIHGCDGPGRELGRGVACLARHRGHAARADREVVSRQPIAVYAVMAGGTPALHARMRERRARPGHRVVAGVALEIREDMVRRL